MREQKERIISIIMPLLFLLVILGLNVAARYDRTFYACGPDASFCLDHGSYKVYLETGEAAAENCLVYYETNGQERILARTGVKSGVGASFEMELPSNIRNDSVRAVIFDAEGTPLPQIDVMRIIKMLPVRQTAVYFVIYLVVVLLLYKGFGGRTGRLLTGLVSVAFLPLYPVFCAAPFQITVLIMTCVSLLFLADRKAKISGENIVRYVFFLTISLVALYFCTECSPFYARNPWDDVSIYYSIGRGITQGYVPYRDMFDHKGPVVFFLFALGHLLVPDRFYGVYLLESFCFSGVLYFIYKMCRLYFDAGRAQAVSVISVIFLLDGSFLVYGGSCEEFTMVIYAAILYGYLAYFSGRKEYDRRWIIWAGVLSGLSFWMKFNMTVCLFALVGMILLHRLLDRHNIIKDIIAAAAGFLGVSVPVVGYFVCADSIGYLKNGYFTANLAYADVKTPGETMAVFGQNVLTAVTDNPGITLVIILGLLSFVISSRYLGSVLGKIGLVMAFAVLVGSTYVSYAFLYYYCLVAVFGVLGLIAAAGFLGDKVLDGKCVQGKVLSGKMLSGRILPEGAVFCLALPCLCLLLLFNTNYREAVVFSENFTLWDVCEKEIENRTPGQEPTVLLYRNHWAQMMTFADVRPAGRYYFAPNISKNIPEINEEQDRYIHEGIADFVVVDHAEQYPSLMEWGLYQYEEILDWQEDADRVQLYCIKR